MNFTKNPGLLKLAVLVFATPLAMACVPAKKGKEINPQFPYNLSSPLAILEMESDLVEISGIDFLSPQKLVGVEDEHGIFYTIDAATGKVLDKSAFAGDGDFEDVAVDGEFIWAIRSNGTLFKMKAGGSRESTREFATALSENNDVEGLCIHPGSNALWLISKEDGSIDEDKTSDKLIYSFNRETGRLEEVLRIEENAIENFIEDQTSEEPDENFMPSALAVHPKTGNIFVLSSEANFILQINSKGELLSCSHIPEKTLPKPEGLAVDGENNLWISSEGKDGNGLVYGFAGR